MGLKIPCENAIEDDVLILGRCSCVSQSRDLFGLSNHGLPTPQWDESWKKVRGCFPGGCGVCGMWVGVEGGERVVKEVVKKLLNKTDLPVSVWSSWLISMY